MSSEIDLIYREWQEAIRDRYNIKGEQVVVAKPSNPAHLSILKEMCLKAGFTSDQANSILLILEKDKKAPALDKAGKDEVERLGLVWKGKGYGKAGKGKGITHKNVDGKLVKVKDKDSAQEPDTSSPEINPNFAKDGEKPEPGQSTIDGSHITSQKPEKEEKPKGTPVEKKLSAKDKEKGQATVEKVKRVISELEEELENTLDEKEREDKEGEIHRLKVLAKNWEKFINAETEEERGEAVREMVEHELLARNSPGKAKRKVYFTENVSGLGAKDGMLTKKKDGSFQSGNGNNLSQMISDTIDNEGMENDVGLRNSSADRTLAKVSGDHNEAGVCAFLDPSESNESDYRKVQEQYISLGGDDRRANKQNQAAAEKVKDYLSKMKPPCEVEKAEAMGHLGNQQIRDKYGIDPKVNPTDFFVYCKDGRRKGISAKIYSNPKNITMKNSGTKKAGANYLGDPTIDDKLDELKEKYNIGNNPTDEEKRKFKTEYLRLWEESMAELAKTPEGQQKLVSMWNEVHGCGEDVATLVTNKKTGDVALYDPSHYCDPEPPLDVEFDGKKIRVKFGKSEEWVELVCKTEKDGSVKLLFNHMKR